MARFETDSPEETHALGVALGRAAPPGTVIALQGDLGAGKTLLAKGIGAGLGVPGLIQSPTFVIVQEHPGGRLPFWHGDLYRLGDASELEHLGLDDLLEAGGVVVIEWAERFPEVLPADHLWVRLEEHREGHRRIEIIAHGPRHRLLEGVHGRR